MKVNFHPASPILRVDNIDKSIEYYLDSLGFKLDWNWEDRIASVSRQKSNIMLSCGDQGLGKAWVYIGISDVEMLYQEYKNSGAMIRQSPKNFSWAYEMQIEDLDSNVLRFGSEPKDGVPFGPWLDMNGKLWE
ncbi:MAG: bleomycin resistance family protein [Ignavibacteriales bacterium]|nr:MAG: bleomycin resistance family protein [Ignavibacteriales bacterium]